MPATVLQLRTELASRFDLPVGVRPPVQVQCVPTGIPTIDGLIGGGIPKGTLTEICGSPSSGRTTVMFSLLAHATSHGECCAWIDATGVFDPTSAVEAGVELERVLWVNCSATGVGGKADKAENALKCTDLLIQAGGFGLVVLDLGDTPIREARRIPLASWFRLRHAVERTGTALVAVELEVCARSCSAIQLELHRQASGKSENDAGPKYAARWTGKRLRGLAIQGESKKHFRARTTEFEAVR